MLKLRNYNADTDFNAIASWCPDERAHAMWCANRFSYPLEKDNFENTLRGMSQNSGDIPLTAIDEKNNIIGFLCYASLENGETGLFKFVTVNKDIRGRGFGKELVEKAVRYAFSEKNTGKVRLHVFSVNASAICCYTSCGFEILSEEKEAFPYHEERWGRITMEKRNEYE